MDEIKSLLLDFLKQNSMMFLSTVSETGPWATTVYYAIDDDFNLYFMSAPNTKHVLDLEKNNQVAGAIAMTNQKFYMQKEGAQITGIALKLDQKSEEYDRGLKLLLTKVWGYNDTKLLELNTVKSMVGEIIKIEINLAMFLNEKVFGEHISKKIIF